MAESGRSAWAIPAALLVAAVVLLMALHRLIGGPSPAVEDPADEQVVAAVRSASADPFRYSGRTVGQVLDQMEPRTGWTDAGWEVIHHEWGGFHATRTYRRAEGGERVYAFTVAPDLDQVWPANGHARALMHRGPRPGTEGEFGSGDGPRGN